MPAETDVLPTVPGHQPVVVVVEYVRIISVIRRLVVSPVALLNLETNCGKLSIGCLDLEYSSKPTR